MRLPAQQDPNPAAWATHKNTKVALSGCAFIKYSNSMHAAPIKKRANQAAGVAPAELNPVLTCPAPARGQRMPVRPLSGARHGIAPGPAEASLRSLGPGGRRQLRVLRTASPARPPSPCSSARRTAAAPVGCMAGPHSGLSWHLSQFCLRYHFYLRGASADHSSFSPGQRNGSIAARNSALFIMNA